MLCGGRTHPSKPIGRRRCNAVATERFEGFEQSLRNRMRRAAQANRILSAAGIRRGRIQPSEDEGQRTGPERVGKSLCLTGPMRPVERHRWSGHMHDQRMVRWASFDSINRRNRIGIARVGTKAVNRLGGKSNDLARLEGSGRFENRHGRINATHRAAVQSA